MIELPFTKMQGLGNDFIVIDDLGIKLATSSPLTAELARQICDRRLGVGADQILWLKKPQDPSLDVRMEIFNADGSEAEMCGNGIRAVALYINQYGSERKLEYTVETLAGVKRVSLQGHEVNVDMGPAHLGGGFSGSGERIEVQGKEFWFYEVNVGNPHAVFFVDDVSRVSLQEVGPLIESHSRFPHRTNVEFVEIKNRDSIRVRVWERGAGITLACGTGACAAAVASLATSRVSGPVNVDLPGGRLRITWDGLTKPILMKGPAKEVFRGVYFF